MPMESGTPIILRLCIIKAVLTYIYTGDVSESLVVGETLLDICYRLQASIDIPSLKELVVFHCIRSISVANFKKQYGPARIYP